MDHSSGLVFRRPQATLTADLWSIFAPPFSNGGFPNVVGEAMATAVPCVATDVGDSAFLVGDSQSVVVPRDPAALSAAIASVLDLDENARMNRSSQARDRIVHNFSSEKMTTLYAALYESVIEGLD